MEENEKTEVEKLLEKIKSLSDEIEDLKTSDTALNENLKAFKEENETLKKEKHDLQVENKKFLNLISLNQDNKTLTDEVLFKGFSKYDRKD